MPREPNAPSGKAMLYAILCYDNEAVVGSWTKEEDDAAMVKLGVVQEKLTKQGRLGPVARLGTTKSGKTLKKGDRPLIVDGPFAETKEQLLGFFIVESSSIEEALEAAKELGLASSSKGSYEIRPLTYFAPNGVTRTA